MPIFYRIVNIMCKNGLGSFLMRIDDGLCVLARLKGLTSESGFAARRPRYGTDSPPGEGSRPFGAVNKNIESFILLQAYSCWPFYYIELFYISRNLSRIGSSDSRSPRAYPVAGFRLLILNLTNLNHYFLG